MKLKQIPKKINESLIKIAVYLAYKDWDKLESELQIYLKQNYERYFIDEVFITSYLFLGFPAMISAFEILQRIDQNKKQSYKINKKNDYNLWEKRGLKLFKKIYADKSDMLLLKVKRMHPEVAKWMLTEGYGKVLSRSFLPIKNREFIIITFLIVSFYPKQLHSHLKGALNIGATINDIDQIFSLIKKIDFKMDIEKALQIWHSIKNQTKNANL